MREGEQTPERIAPDETRSAGRGLIYIATAKIFFIITAYAVHLMLPRLLGSKEAFGLYSTAMSLASILNNVLIAATVQTVSKLVSEDETRAAPTLRQGLGIQLVVGTVLGGVMFLLAPVISTYLLRDEALTPLLRTTSAVLFAYALYAALVGSLNGRRVFHKQAGLDVTFSTLRTGGILGGAVLGGSLAIGPLGAIGGFASAAVAILLVALIVVGTGRPGSTLPLRRWTSFMAPLLLYQTFLNGILLSDILVMKGTIASLGVDAGMTAEAARELASGHVGVYSAAQKFALVPYQLMLSMTFIVFPMISRATSAGDRAAARATIRAAMRFSLLVLLSVAAPLAGAADGVMRVAYPDEYLAGAGALGILVFGAAAFALFVITATVMSGAGRPSLAAIIGGFGLLAVVTGNRVFVQLVGIEGDVPSAAALGTSLGMGFAMLAGAAVIRRTFGALIAPATVVRAGIAGGVAFVVARFLPHDSAAMAIVALGAGFLVYGATLALTRELRRADLEVAFRVLKRR